MRKYLMFFMAFTVPLFIFLNIWQVFCYESLEDSVVSLEKEQDRWIEKNKRIVTSLSILSSPERIERLAVDKLGLRKKEPGSRIYIYSSENDGRLYE